MSFDDEVVMVSPSDSQERKRKGDENSIANEPPFKRTCLASSQEPDVTIIVGGNEFREYSQVLRCVSGYFDGAFRSEMKEAQEMKFEFPDKDPKEWELFMSVVSPLPSVRVDKDNVETILSWCDEFCVLRLPAGCNTIYFRKFFGLDKKFSGTNRNMRLWEAFSKRCADKLPEEKMEKKKAVLARLFDVLETALKYHLEKTIKEACNVLGYVIKSWPAIFNNESFKRIVSCLGYEKFRIQTVFPVGECLPKALETTNIESLLSNELLPYLIQEYFEKRVAQKQSKQLIEESLRLPKLLQDTLPRRRTLSRITDDTMNDFCSKALKNEMAKSRVWRDKVPQDWR